MEQAGILKTRIAYIALILAFVACTPEPKKDKKVEEKAPKPQIVRPVFDADSAYAYIARQIDFGPRVPNTKTHAKTAQYLSDKLSSFNFEVQIQEGQVLAYTQEKLNIKNIIGSYRPELNNRIMLFAHWDTRPFADQDTTDTDKPILGANDGASGVGVLLEIARQINIQQPNIGVDIFFFDAEDYGQSDGELSSWALGSQYWAKYPHKVGYSANFGILLDMVGAKGAVFTKESISMQYAAAYMNMVWNNAEALGHQEYFVSRVTRFVGIDDHFYVNTLAKIPSIDIIQFDENTGAFGPYWHTHQDNMDVIDKETLQAVGETVLATVIQESKSF